MSDGFPRERFAKAGASEDEIDTMELKFDRSDVNARASLAASFASMSDGMLAEHVELLREGGHFDVAEHVSDAEDGDDSAHRDDDDTDDGDDDDAGEVSDDE